MSVRSVVLLFVLILSACWSGAWAAGGVYLDDVKVTNNGAVALFDNFDDGGLTGWYNLSDATCECKSGKPPCGMLLNKHIFCAAGASHNLAIGQPEVVELSANVFVTPPEEQYDIAVKKYAASTCKCGCGGPSDIMYITLYAEATVPPRKTTPKVDFYIQQVGSEAGCRVGVEATQSNGSTSRSGCSGAPIPQRQWTPILLRLDPRTKLARLFVDGRQVSQTGYDPASLSQIQQLNLCCGFGDGSKRKD